MEAMHADSRIADMTFKIDPSDKHTFKKMHVRHRNELVTLRLEDDVNPLQTTGTYLKPKEFHKAMQDDDTIILDARNDYRSEEHTSELQSRGHLVCRLLLEK